MPPRRFAVLRYMEEFRCIGADCEDNCCHEWTVLVDQSTHQRLKKALSNEPERFAKLQLLPPSERTRESFAEIAEAADGDCPMLSEKLCVIHGRHGAAYLPAVCASYPRSVSIVGGRAEMTGALSCPEVARRALLHPGAVELREATAALFSEVRTQRTYDLGVSPWISQLDELRGTLYQLFGLDGYSLGSRLYFALMLGERINGFFHAEAETLELERLREEIASIETQSLREALHQRYQELPGQSELAASLLAQALAARIATQQLPRMVGLVNDVFATYGIVTDEKGAVTLAPAELARGYEQRWQRLRERHAARIDGWLQNYAQHYVFHNWYAEASTLSLYVQTLALKLALIRFLVAGHPLAVEAASRPDEEAGPLLDQAVVKVVYTLARAIDHSPHFVEALAKVMREKLGLSTTLALLKL
jgi:lysine-N-methylase